MYDLLTPEEDTAAALRGWQLSYVYDMRPNKWIVMVVPPTAARSVLDAARQMCPLSLKAVRLAMQPVTRSPQHDRRPRAKKTA
jgi:hypothetical protein